ncbi:MAG: cob(I)yrinic acid a,c-diamide adenosyltransferase [Saprospiraceae bacterium]|nr:cob(I)yrinic acid a,c-diamide adenosyltransferase [Saprospiraceae bacterium]
MKIYTKSGDKGTTGLFGGTRVDKDDIRVEAYGSLDELNSHVGMLRAMNKESDTDIWLSDIQKNLFIIGSHLATDPAKTNVKLPVMKADATHILEQAIDSMEQKLDPLKNFILPAGSVSVAQAHICRTICRRAERRVVSLSKIGKVDEYVIVFLNRLSDFFFVLARFIAHQTGINDVLWIPE